ncbi:MAG: Stk1 family PASTA domain-containing Ser/Thr kinase [Lachnospiraceae bacterium]|nr:Stk1 family PASTA domain-containing Ser/Thr kinase [Lachnospiraceae bacterium]
MIKIGMMIGDRYEILEKIGTGGMSDVYKAKCHKLNRFVAVKVLKQEFSENGNFVSKFRTEAQAAAGLAHPNIVNVYDVGEENGIHYIVMELVEGITLKQYIEKKARLSYKEAVSIAIQVSMGIEAAHNNHIIHRDIKPQNIMISKDGKVKVTDFGIAKAATSNTITSNVMGSVHYTSPEQARGGYSDEKSDIYSLGVTMFEMLTGRVPFNGETTVAIAIKHIQEELPSPKEYVTEIPTSVENIVLKCCQKSPDRRYQNMAELVADLKQSLMNPDENFVVIADPDMDGGTRAISESDMAQIKSRTAYTEEYVSREDSLRLRSDTEPVYQDNDDADGAEDYDYDPKMEKLTTILAVVAGIIILIILIILATKLFGSGTGLPGGSGPILSEESSESVTAPTIAMPNVTGMTLEDARNTLANLGILTEVEYQESDAIDEGVVINASANTGDSVEVGSTVTLMVSAGPQGVEIEKVTGMTYEDAKNKLVSLGFVVNKAEAYSDTVAEGLVISQSPADSTKAPKGSVVTLTVSLGKEQKKIAVPKLVGLPEEDGTFTLIEAGLEIGSIAEVYTSEVPVGYICYQSYSEGTYVDPGTAIDIKVSMGPGEASYKCNASITAPTFEEAPEYVAGSEVSIKLVTDDGQVLLDTRTSTFPQAANYYGLTASGGTITITYKVVVMGEPIYDPATGEPMVTPSKIEERSFTRRIEFERE